MSIRLYNIRHKDTVHTPLLIVHGETLEFDSGVITVSHRGNAFPPLHYEVNSRLFKALVHLDGGENDLIFTHRPGVVEDGYPHYHGDEFEPNSISVQINYAQLSQNKPIHLCLLLAQDSPEQFATPASLAHHGNDLDLAVKKLRIAGRLMQAYTNEQMLRTGFGKRTFNFVEEYTKDTQFAQEKNTYRNTIKVHILRSQKTLEEIRDPSNPDALFGIAKEALDEYGGPFADNGETVQAAVIILDTLWDPSQSDSILGHVALGGSSGNCKLAVFGSHGLYSWPSSLEAVAPAFQDATLANIEEVANDADQCGRHWECLNITLGAFMHEIGHSLGCPHQSSGVMLRDYVTLNRSFVSRETECLRTDSPGFCPILPKDECKWHRFDLLRFLYHPSFALPSDYLDPSFHKSNKAPIKPTLLSIGNGNIILTSESGIYAIECYKDDGISHGYIEYLPKSLGGQGPQTEVFLNIYQLKHTLPEDKREGDFTIRVLVVGQEEAHFKSEDINDDNIVYSDFGLNRGMLTGFKSEVSGNKNGGSPCPLTFFDPEKVVNVRVYYGAALDGVRFDLRGQRSSYYTQAPPVPSRDYDNPYSTIVGGFRKLGIDGEDEVQTAEYSWSVTYGNATDNYSDFPLNAGEKIERFNIRGGAWIDALQVVTSTGRTSEMFGNATGGHGQTLSAPTGFEIVGLHGSVGNWVDSIGVICVPQA